MEEKNEGEKSDEENMEGKGWWKRRAESGVKREPDEEGREKEGKREQKAEMS